VHIAAFSSELINPADYRLCPLFKNIKLKDKIKLRYRKNIR